MTPFPKLALAAALLAGAGSLALAAPAAAKKDPPADPNAPAALKLSPDVIKQAQPAKTAVESGNVAAAEPLVAGVEASAKTDDDKYVAAALRLELEQAKIRATPAGQRPDETAEKAPLEALIASPRTTPENKAKYAYQRGDIAFSANQQAEAIRWFQQAKQMGYNDPQLDLQIITAQYGTGNVAAGNAAAEEHLKAAQAAGQKPDENFYKYVLGRNIKGTDKQTTIAWMQRWLTAYPTSKNWHDALTIYGIQQPPLATLDRDQTMDLFRLMRRTGSLDQYAYEQYADKAIKAGLPDEAKTVLAEGKSNGKLPASGDVNTLTAAAARSAAAGGSLTTLETRAQSQANGQLAAQTGDAYLGRGDYAKAVALYRTALTKGGVQANEVNTHLGIALAMSGDAAGAKTAFAAVQGSPSADIAQFWTIAVDHPAAA